MPSRVQICARICTHVCIRWVRTHAPVCTCVCTCKRVFICACCAFLGPSCALPMSPKALGLLSRFNINNNSWSLRSTMFQALFLQHLVLLMHLMKSVLLLSPFFRWWNSGTQRWRNLRGVTQLGSGKAGLQTQAGRLQLLLWHVKLRRTSPEGVRHPRLFPDKAESYYDSAPCTVAVGLIFYPAVPEAHLDIWEPRAVAFWC